MPRMSNDAWSRCAINRAHDVSRLEGGNYRDTIATVLKLRLEKREEKNLQTIIYTKYLYIPTANME